MRSVDFERLSGLFKLGTRHSASLNVDKSAFCGRTMWVAFGFQMGVSARLQFLPIAMGERKR